MKEKMKRIFGENSGTAGTRNKMRSVAVYSMRKCNSIRTCVRVENEASLLAVASLCFIVSNLIPSSVNNEKISLKKVCR